MRCPITGVAMHFGGIRALDGIDLTVKEGEILGIIGPNGAGKTTLFNVVTGMLRPTAGSVKSAAASLSDLHPMRSAATASPERFRKCDRFRA